MNYGENIEKIKNEAKEVLLQEKKNEKKRLRLEKRIKEYDFEKISDSPTIGLMVLHSNNFITIQYDKNNGEVRPLLGEKFNGEGMILDDYENDLTFNHYKEIFDLVDYGIKERE